MKSENKNQNHQDADSIQALSAFPIRMVCHLRNGQNQAADWKGHNIQAEDQGHCRGIDPIADKQEYDRKTIGWNGQLAKDVIIEEVDQTAEQKGHSKLKQLQRLERFS